MAVLWTAILLSTLATALLIMTRSDSRRLQTEIGRLQAGEAAEAGIKLAAIAMSYPTGGDWPVDGTIRALKFEGADLEVSVVAESGKIDINAANPDLIRGLLVVEGQSPGAADTLVRQIAARRTAKTSSQSGSTQGDGSGVAFESVAALLTVPGMTRDLYDRLAPNLTVYSGAPNVDTSVASRDVLAAIPGNTVADVEAAMRDRSSPGHGIVSAAGDKPNRIGQAFTVTSVAHMPGGTIARRAKVIRLTGSPWEPIWVLAIE